MNNNHQSIGELKQGDSVRAFYVIRKLELKTKKDGQPYLSFEFGDATGRISGTLWTQANEMYEQLEVGTIARVLGSVSVFNDNLQLSIERIRPSLPDDNVSPVDYIPRKDIDFDHLQSQFQKILKSVKEPDLQKLIQLVFDDAFIKKYTHAPGGKLWHHAYIGGLLEHTLSIIQICETMSKKYYKINRDLLVTGAIFHDVGKLDEYTYENGFIDFTDEGRLWGHISMGAQWLRQWIESLEKTSGFSLELKKQLIHLVLSHQGQLDHGSPITPKTLEAMVLYYADEMDSKANALDHILDRDGEPGRKWSKFIPILDRFIYLGNSESEPNQNEELKDDLFS